ncbi:hypothetical protein NNG64_07790 [Bacillus siamensis]|uniref:Uncharacterized protein n=1 Tax=Bacillus siamensis TaxID=659243 RepID=A0AAI8N0B3_9BACI|nr:MULTISPECIES: hypothetical protein [Bacillus]AME04981.1 hypothetical protein AUL54_00915 [Bacillus sp. SDLI1]AUJ77396.1 hypothetical protein CWD84_11535 [Bacillus siamensis]UUA85687.1 hypothetical protein NNG64_07790 [Bacillus siamensis]
MEPELIFLWNTFTESPVFQAGMYTACAVVLVIGLSMPAVRLFQALERGKGRPAVIEKVRRTGVMKNGRHELVLILNVTNQDGTHDKRELSHAACHEEISCFYEGAPVWVTTAADGRFMIAPRTSGHKTPK